MQTTINPKTIEKRLIFLQSRDGVLDMFFGFMMVAAALNEVFTFYEWSQPWYIRFLILILMVPFVAVKLWVTTPRMGHVKMKPVAGGRKQVLVILTTVGVLLTVILLAANILQPDWLDGRSFSWSPVVEFLALAAIFGLIGWLMGLPTLMATGIILGFAWPISEMISLETIAGLPAVVFTLGIPGLIIILYGAISLVKFFEKYPRKNLNADYEPGNE